MAGQGGAAGALQLTRARAAALESDLPCGLQEAAAHTPLLLPGHATCGCMHLVWVGTDHALNLRQLPMRRAFAEAVPDDAAAAASSPSGLQNALPGQPERSQEHAGVWQSLWPGGDKVTLSDTTWRAACAVTRYMRCTHFCAVPRGRG